MVFAFIFLITIFAMLRPAWAQTEHSIQTEYIIQVGAKGDDASRGNRGVGAEIRTHITSLVGQDLSTSFWVGDNMESGAFIQFGYELWRPGQYCLYGEQIGDHMNCLGSLETIGSSDARWFWQYWPNPNVTDFYFADGAANSAGPDGRWHLYQIRPNVANGWNFTLDEQTVWSFNDFQVSKSGEPAFVVAEEVTTTLSSSGSLGPVEFRNLSYLTDHGWQYVTSLRAISGSSVIPPDFGSMPYGVTVLGANHIIAGTGQQLRQNGEPLWPQLFKLTLSVPSGVPISIDGSSYFGAVADLPLSEGSHSLSVPEIFQIDSMNRLRFTSWSDGSTELDRIIYLRSDISLQAIYIEQHKLTIVSPLPSSGDGWYDQGTTASFYSNTMPRVTNTLGVVIFIGWQDENRNLVTTSGTGSIVMDRPHTLVARWLSLDYLIPIAAAVMLGLVIVFGTLRIDGLNGEANSGPSDSAIEDYTCSHGSVTTLRASQRPLARSHEVLHCPDVNTIQEHSTP
jgi:hypothetical protein